MKICKCNCYQSSFAKLILILNLIFSANLFFKLSVVQRHVEMYLDKMVVDFENCYLENF